MANFQSDLITANDQIDISDKMVNGDRTGGLLLYATAIYTLLSTEAAADTIQLFDLPAGAVIIPQLSHATCSADPGTALTFDVGDAGDVDRYANDILLASGGQVAFTAGTMPAAVATPYQPTEKTRIYATVVTATTLTAAVKVAFTIAYRIKG